MIHYVATHLGFVRDKIPHIDQVTDIQPRIRLTKNVRLAHPFESWKEADEFAKTHYSHGYYAILKPTHGEIEHKSSIITALLNRRG